MFIWKKPLGRFYFKILCTLASEGITQLLVTYLATLSCPSREEVSNLHTQSFTCQ